MVSFEKQLSFLQRSKLRTRLTPPGLTPVNWRKGWDSLDEDTWLSPGTLLFIRVTCFSGQDRKITVPGSGFLFLPLPLSCYITSQKLLSICKPPSPPVQNGDMNIHLLSPPAL